MIPHIREFIASADRHRLLFHVTVENGFKRFNQRMVSVEARFKELRDKDSLDQIRAAATEFENLLRRQIDITEADADPTVPPLE